MRLSKRRKSAISGNLFTGLIVGGFVAVIVIALVWTNYLPPTQQGTQITFQELTLFGGPASMHSYTTTCLGATAQLQNGGAELDLYAQNPTPNPITIQNVTIYGNGVQNATVYVALSNSCLTISEAGVSVPAGGDYQLTAYVSESLAFASTYRCVVFFSNGQILNQSLIAQS
jgi:hypothetical protein